MYLLPKPYNPLSSHYYVCLCTLLSSFALPSVSVNKHEIEPKKPLVGIYGASLAHIQKYPYTVSTYTDALAMISGGGAILNHHWILVSSSQLYGLPADDITIRGGSDDGQTGGQSSKIDKMITNYTGQFKIDIALLKTKTKLTFNKKLKPVKLAKTIPKEGSMAALSGFGKNEIRSGVLAAANFKITNEKSCQKYYKSNTIFCADSNKYKPAFVSTYSHRLARITGSGAILNENWILVTASQLYNHPAYDVMIRAGSDYGTVGGQYSKITKLITKFTQKYKVDLALLKTQDQLIFNNRVQPINIAEFVPQTGSKAMLSGFGKKENRSGELNAAQFEIVNPEICKWKYNDDTIFCADAFDSHLASDDLGDPLVQEKELVGIFVGSEGVWPYAFTPVARWRECIIDAMKTNSTAGEDSDRINESYYEGIDDDVN